MMLPVLALVGRPNVGKSTLFNRLTSSRDALVADLPGATRDRHYGAGRVGSRPYLIIDTGGFEPVAKEGILYQMARQTQQAVKEADSVIFIVDARQGATPHDMSIAAYLRKTGRPVQMAVNKAEGMQYDAAVADFYALGFGKPHAISSAHGAGVHEMIEAALAACHAHRDKAAATVAVRDPKSGPKIAIVGRPNVGKSTLVNALLGEERMIASDMPGTTRDSIMVDFEQYGRNYTLIDTAGLRRRGKVTETIEKFSIIKTLQSITEANVVTLLLDAQREVSEQDAHIARFILEQGRALVVGMNKWDGLEAYARRRIKTELARKLQFLDFAECQFISAAQKIGMRALIHSIDHAYAAAMTKLPTPKLTRTLLAAVKFQPPRRCGPVRPKLRYAHQGGQNPPVIVIHGNALDALTETYRRYLERRFRETFGLTGTPLRLAFRSSQNPYIEENCI